MASKEKPTDAAVLLQLGERIAQRRLALNRTQRELAKEAGVSPRTLARLEAGASTQLTNLIRVLRALDLLRNMDALVPAPTASPLAQLRAQRLERTERSRASRRGRTRDGHAARGTKPESRRDTKPESSPDSKRAARPGTTWTWGDESEKKQ